MAKPHSGFVGQLLQPWWVKTATGAVGAVASYDATANQFGWPKIPKVWGMTGSLLPWWGWLLVLQTVLVLALFEYVRRTGDGAVEQNDSELREAVTADSEAGKANFTPEIQRLGAEVAALSKVTSASRDDITLIADILMRQMAPHALDVLERSIERFRGACDGMIRQPHEKALLTEARDAHENARSALTQLGIDEAEIHELTETRKEEIRKSAEYLVIKAGEEGRWPDESSKQNWHLQSAIADVWSAELAKLRQQLVTRPENHLTMITKVARNAR